MRRCIQVTAITATSTVVSIRFRGRYIGSGEGAGGAAAPSRRVCRGSSSRWAATCSRPGMRRRGWGPGGACAWYVLPGGARHVVRLEVLQLGPQRAGTNDVEARWRRRTASARGAGVCGTPGGVAEKQCVRRGGVAAAGRCQRRKTIGLACGSRAGGLGCDRDGWRRSDSCHCVCRMQCPLSSELVAAALAASSGGLTRVSLRVTAATPPPVTLHRRPQCVGVMTHCRVWLARLR